MDAIKLTVRCMAWPEGEVWVAACIDLTLAAQGATRLQAQQRLHAQILSYVREAVTIDAEHAEALLGRRAPWRDRLRFAFWHAVAHRPRLRRAAGRLLRQVGAGIQRKLAYSEPLPLLPA